MNYDIIPMTAEHIPQVAALERKCFSAPWSERMLREHLDNECAATLVAQGEDGTVLGYAGILVVLDEGYITNIAVESAYRRQGIASQLLQVFGRFALPTPRPGLSTPRRAMRKWAAARITTTIPRKTPSS